jgi:DNA-repair protein complementing XP-A cells
MDLDDETLRRIEENRRKALELKAKREEAAALLQNAESDRKPPTASLEGDESSSRHIVHRCCVCDLSNIDDMYLDVYKEKVCRQCARSSLDFTQITKQDAVAKYLVSEYSLKSIPHQLRDNPHKKGWTEMKLYLRKHVLALAVKKWGSEQNLEEEVAARSEKIAKRKLTEAESFLTSISRGDNADRAGKVAPVLSKRQKSRNYMKKLTSELRGDTKK